jgi:hypothetical protein
MLYWGRLLVSSPPKPWPFHDRTIDQRQNSIHSLIVLTDETTAETSMLTKGTVLAVYEAYNLGSDRYLLILLSLSCDALPDFSCLLVAERTESLN